MNLTGNIRQKLRQKKKRDKTNKTITNKQRSSKELNRNSSGKTHSQSRRMLLGGSHIEWTKGNPLNLSEIVLYQLDCSLHSTMKKGYSGF